MTEFPHDAGCVFCKIVAGQIPCLKLHEDEDTIAFMDIKLMNWEPKPGDRAVVEAVYERLKRRLTSAVQAP